jgi:cell division protease FtsH
VLVGDNEQELFLGREIQSRREVSERTAQLVDAEVLRIIREAYERARSALSENLDALHRVAAALLERETLTGDEVAAIARGEVLPPLPPSDPPPPSRPNSPPALVIEPRRTPPLLGGPEPSPA